LTPRDLRVYAAPSIAATGRATLMKEQASMGFFDSIKQFLGIGGIKVDLQIPPQAHKAAGVVQGTVNLTAKSDQHVLELYVKLVESWSTGRGEDKEEKDFELGKINLPAPFDMKAGEVRAVQFALPFQMIKSNNDVLKEKGGALGALGKMGAFADAEKSTFKIVAEADVKGTALDPGDTKEIQLL